MTTPTPSLPTLLPCPHCNGSATYHIMCGDEHYVMCESCGAETAIVIAPMDEAYALLASRWNRRAEAKAQPGDADGACKAMLESLCDGLDKLLPGVVNPILSDPFVPKYIAAVADLQARLAEVEKQNDFYQIVLRTGASPDYLKALAEAQTANAQFERDAALAKLAEAEQEAQHLTSALDKFRVSQSQMREENGQLQAKLAEMEADRDQVVESMHGWIADLATERKKCEMMEGENHRLRECVDADKACYDDAAAALRAQLADLTSRAGRKVVLPQAWTHVPHMDKPCMVRTQDDAISWYHRSDVLAMLKAAGIEPEQRAGTGSET